jgi:sortase A
VKPNPLRRAISIVILAVGVSVISFSVYEISASRTGSQVIPVRGALNSPLTQNTASTERAPITLVKPATGELIGTLEIPRLTRMISIYEGTEESELKYGAGHYIKSVLPGVMDNSVIAGHRDSHFSGFDALEIGDLLNVETTYGRFVYKIESFRIVEADDRTVIVPTPVATLTLSTCYPFFFVGNAPKRFIVTAHLIT